MGQDEGRMLLGQERMHETGYGRGGALRSDARTHATRLYEEYLFISCIACLRQPTIATTRFVVGCSR